MPLYQSDCDVCGIAHGDDFVFVGKRHHLQAVAGHLAKKCKVKVAMEGREAAGALRLVE